MTLETVPATAKGAPPSVVENPPPKQEAKAPAKKTKLKAVDPKAAEPSKPKILIFGKAGVGKTWTSLDFPSVYYIDTEGGASRDQYTDKLKASGGMYFGPEQGSQDFESVIQEVKTLATEQHSFKTLVIDSISKISNLEISKEQERLGDKDAFGASKKPSTNLTRRLVSWIDRIDMNVILIAHEKPLWAKGEQIGETFDAYEKLEYELDLVMQIIKAGANRISRVKKSRLAGFADASTFPWAYNDFADRYGKDVIEKQGEVLKLATPEQLSRLKTLLDVWKAPEGQEDKWLNAAKVSKYDEMDSSKLAAVLNYIETKIKGDTK